MKRNQRARSHDGGVMRIEVDASVCRGEGLCERICPQLFHVVDGISRVRHEAVPHAAMPCCREAAQHCPTSAIRLIMEAPPPRPAHARAAG